jgi:hypothetical protein
MRLLVLTNRANKKQMEQYENDQSKKLDGSLYGGFDGNGGVPRVGG